MEASPRSSLEVVEPHLPLEVLVVAFDAPAELRQPHQFTDRGGGRQRHEVMLRGRRFPRGPFAEQPLFRARCSALRVFVRGAHPRRCEARRLLAARTLAPGDGAIRQFLGELADRHRRPFGGVRVATRWSFAGCLRGHRKFGPGSPNPCRVMNAARRRATPAEHTVPAADARYSRSCWRAESVALGARGRGKSSHGRSAVARSGCTRRARDRLPPVGARHAHACTWSAGCAPHPCANKCHPARVVAPPGSAGPWWRVATLVLGRVGQLPWSGRSSRSPRGRRSTPDTAAPSPASRGAPAARAVQDRLGARLARGDNAATPAHARQPPTEWRRRRMPR